jgi:hypothetical protein
MKTYFSKQSKTRSKNIMKVFLDPKSVGRRIRDKIYALFKIIDLIVKYRNIYIESKFVVDQNFWIKDAQALLRLLCCMGTKQGSSTNAREP